ncbi:MAG: Gfo/Idh/MocA family oxidoreductase [Ruminococcaceae bacterium]|nr:Gfo/Idh/MocA family oxidoreductase [Oscillospiraceae bacterium]
MNMKKYGIALIGCGSMGAAHLDDIYCKDDVEIKCVCDINEEHAKDFARKYRAERTETDYRKAVSAEDVDIVIIATYPQSHLEILTACLQNGKHVLCEKPIASNLEDGKKMAQLIKENPACKVHVGYILRHNKTYQKVAEMIQSGAIGKPIVMRMTQNHHTMDWQKYLNLIKDTSPIIDCGVHYIDIMHWVTGAEITEVSGIGLRTEPDVPKGKYNYGLMTAKLSDGSIGYYEAGWSNTISSCNVKEFMGPRGRIRITLQMLRSENHEEGDMIEYYKYPEKTYETININCKRKPTGDQLEDLIHMIETDAPGSPTIDEVIDSFTWAVKADEIIRGGLSE